MRIGELSVTSLRRKFDRVQQRRQGRAVVIRLVGVPVIIAVRVWFGGWISLRIEIRDDV